MTKMVIERPFKKLDHRYELRLQPAASLHVLGGQPLAPSALSRFGKITKRAFRDRQTLEIRKYRPTRSWREAIPNSARDIRSLPS
jgi:hypothetical protein